MGVELIVEAAAKDIVAASLAVADVRNLQLARNVSTRNNQSMKCCTSAQCLDKEFDQYHEKNAGQLSCRCWVHPFYRHTKSQTAEEKAGQLLKLHILAAARLNELSIRKAQRNKME